MASDVKLLGESYLELLRLELARTARKTAQLLAAGLLATLGAALLAVGAALALHENTALSRGDAYAIVGGALGMAGTRGADRHRHAATEGHGLMDERAQLQASIERTHEALVQKAHRIEHRVVEAKDRVVHVLDVRGRYRDDPWPFLFTAVVAGLATGAWSSRAAARHALGNHQRVELVG